MSTSSEVSASSSPKSGLEQLLSPDLLTQDQQQAIDAAYEGDRLIIGEMGAGKTIVAATAITELLFDKEVKRVLIVSTPKIANTVWPLEFAKWQHTCTVRVRVATGDPDQRYKAMTDPNAQVVVMTFNTLQWAAKEKLLTEFDGLLIDETTKLTEPGGAQFKALRPHLKKFNWRCGLTGTPIAENLMKAYCQIMLVDAGQSLGTRYDGFRLKYFTPLDYKQYRWAVRPGCEQQIIDAIRPRLHFMGDYTHELPPINYVTHPVAMPEHLREYYDQMRKTMVTEDSEAVTAAVLVQKLSQITCGFIYDELGDPIRKSDYRLDALSKLRSGTDENLIVFYWYKADLEALRKRLPSAEVLTPANLADTTKRWNRGEIKTLLLHPRSAGHGLQLEQGGHHIIWYQPYWSNDLHRQANARVWRRGQNHPVTITTIVAEDSIDEVMVGTVAGKKITEATMMKYLKTGKIPTLPPREG